MQARVYGYLLRFARTDGHFLVDPNDNFDQIAIGVLDFETRSLFFRESLLSNEDDGAWVIFKFREDLAQALVNLHDEGKIQWVVRMGWPWIFVPEAVRAGRRFGETPEQATARAERTEYLRTMPYREYLQTPEWRERREEHLDAAQHRCQVCNRQGHLHVHHRTYARRGNEHFADLIVLCATCHQHFHDKLRVQR